MDKEAVVYQLLETGLRARALGALPTEENVRVLNEWAELVGVSIRFRIMQVDGLERIGW